MSYKAKAASPEYRGGAINEPQPPKPRPRFPCFAEGCPMPGTIWSGITQGGTGDQPGTCAWHYGVKPLDIPKVTRVFQDWACVSHEINEARAAQYGDAAADPAALNALFDLAVQRLRPHVQMGGWGDEFEPKQGEDYRGWGKRLEAFLGGRVVEALSIHQHRKAA